MLFAGGDAGEPVAVTQVFVGETDFFGAEEKRDSLGGEGLADEIGGGFEAVCRVLRLAVAEGGGSDDQGAVGDGISYRGEFFALLHDGGGTDGRAGFAECEFVGFDDAEVEESEVAHGAGGGAKIERIAGADEDDAEVLSGVRQGSILRRPASGWLGSFNLISLRSR